MMWQAAQDVFMSSAALFALARNQGSQGSRAVPDRPTRQALQWRYGHHRQTLIKPNGPLQPKLIIV